MKMVSLQISDEEYVLIEQLVFRGHFKSRSDMIRAGLAMLLKEWKVKPEVARAICIAHQGARKRPREEFAKLDKPDE